MSDETVTGRHEDRSGTWRKITAMTTRAPRSTLAVLSTALLPPWPDLPAPLRAEIEAEVNVYVARQVERMPTFLRIPYVAVLGVFGVSAILRYGRPFTRLAPAQRDAWIRVWAQSPLVPMRDFVRMVRSCALLAWFDHPLVSQALATTARSQPR